MGAFQTAYPIYSKSDGALQVEQAHNDYLQVLADFGVAGLAAAAWFIVSIGRAFKYGIRSRDRMLAGLALGGGAGIFAMLVHSLFDFNLQIPSNALLFLLLAAVVSHVGGSVARARVRRGQEGERNHRIEPAPRLGGTVSIG
jgi:O-antigen ligase